MLAILTMLSLGCGDHNPTNETQNSCPDLGPTDSGFVQLPEGKVIGEQLIIFGKVVDATTGQPIVDAKLFLYQADREGNYNSSFLGMPSYAKIRGEVKTNSYGCFKIGTTVPGNYPGQTDGKHIHVVAKAKSYKKWNFEFLFEGAISGALRAAIQQNNDAIILDLNQKENDHWMVETVIRLHKK